jgi:hypothetical protein
MVGTVGYRVVADWFVSDADMLGQNAPVRSVVTPW